MARKFNRFVSANLVVAGFTFGALPAFGEEMSTLSEMQSAHAQYKIAVGYEVYPETNAQGTDVYFYLKLYNTKFANCLLSVQDSDGNNYSNKCQVTNYFANGLSGSTCAVSTPWKNLPAFKYTVQCTHFEHKPFEASGTYYP